MNTAMVLTKVRQERERQEDLKQQGKFKHTCADAEVPLGDKLAILIEEVGEVAEAILQVQDLNTLGDPIKDLRKELIQVAAVAVAWAESL